MSDRTPIDVWVLVGVAFVTAGLFTYAIPEHIFDSSWTDHARNHVFQSLFWIDGFCLLQAVVAWKPYQRGEPWAWWALAVSTLAVYGGYFIPTFVTLGGAPGPLDDIVFAALFVGAAVGLGMGASRLQIFGASKPNN